MRTVIRLQNKYHRNNNTNKIVVQGKNRNLRGSFIEHIGWWLPHPTQNHQRSIMINKYRARYWIGVGCEFGPKIQRFFSFMGMAQSPWISFGSKTLYKEPKEVKQKRWKDGLDHYIKNAHGMVQNKKFSDDQIKEIQAQYFRKFKLEETLGNYLNNEIEVDKLIGESKNQTQNENTIIRTEKYKVLKKFYDSVEQGKIFIDQHKKQILFDKLQELVEQGIYGGEYENYTATIKGKEYNYKDLEQIFREQYEDLKKNRVAKTQLFKQQFVPITQEETQQLFMKHQNMNLRQAMKKTREIFLKAKDDNKTVLRFHIIGQILDEKIKKDIGQAEEEGYENIVVDDVMELQYSLLTPPDIEEYDPEDWYDLSKNAYYDLTPASKDHSRLLDRPKRRAYLKYKDDVDRESLKKVDTDSEEFRKEIPDHIQEAFHDIFKEEFGNHEKKTIF